MGEHPKIIDSESTTRNVGRNSGSTTSNIRGKCGDTTGNMELAEVLYMGM